MDPTKQNLQGGKPFGRGANNSYSQEELDRLLWSYLVEHGMAAAAQGRDVIGDSSACAGINGVGNIGRYNTPAMPHPLAVQRPSASIPAINSQYHHPLSSGHWPGSFARFPAHGGDAVGRPAPFPAHGGDNGSLYQYTFARQAASLSNQPATSFDQQYPAANWQLKLSSTGAHQRHPSPTNFPQPGADSAWRLRQRTSEWLSYEAGTQSGSRAPAVSTLEELRRLLLDDQDNADLVMNPHISKPIASLLDQGGQEDHHTAVRFAVLSRITSDVHTVMASDAGSEVFVALLRAIVRASKSKRLELNAIIQAAASPNARSRLMGVANQEPGETALKVLFRVVAQMDRPELWEPLVNCLIDGWIMEQSNGPDLLHELFTMVALPYQYCATFIRRLAIPRFREMVTSEFGWICMLECLRNARNDELTDLEQTVVNDTFEIAKSGFGCCFLQVVLKDGHCYYRHQLKNGIRERVELNLMELSMDRFGNYVVEVCFVSLPMASLSAFLGLTNEQLFALARDRYASRVLRSLLDTSKDGTNEDVNQVIRDVLSKDHPPASSTKPNSTASVAVAASQKADDADVEFRGALGRVRNLLLTSVLEPLEFADSSAYVLQLLLESEEDWYITVRRNVFGGIMRNLRTFMESREWHVVFLKFLRPDRLDDLELEAIVGAICSGTVPVMRIANSECGEASLIGLMRVLTRLPCRKRFIDHLLSEGLMEQSKDPGLLPHIFAEFPHEDSSICIRHAINAFDGGPLSKSMLDSICICLQAATGVDLKDLEEKILSNTARLAVGKKSHLFLKDILRLAGDSRLKEGIANHIVEHFASLSLHRYGHSLVVECFLRRPQLLERVLKGFLDLSDAQLASLVTDRRGCYVIRNLLLAAKKDYPDETKTLAVWVRDLMPDASDDPPT